MVFSALLSLIICPKIQIQGLEYFLKETESDPWKLPPEGEFLKTIKILVSDSCQILLTAFLKGKLRISI